MTDLPKVYTADDLATLFQCERAHVNSKASKRDWPHFMVGRQYRFTAADVQQIIASTHTARTAAAKASDDFGHKGRGKATR